MNTVPIIPDSAPFSAEQRAWLNGFLAGLLNRGASSGPAPTGASASPQCPLLIAFGSQSGNAESLAKRLAREATGRGFAARAAGLDSLQPADLVREQNVLLITSTWGEGDMPDNAMSFWDSINQNGSSPALTGVKYSVLALGDKNYGDTFCLAGKKIDARLAELGAIRVVERVDCDVEFDDLAKTWSTSVLAALESTATLSLQASSNPIITTEIVEESGYSKKNPFQAQLIANLELNATGSAKDTRHIAFSLAGSGLDYEVGDALGVYVKNCAEVVDSIISAHGFDPHCEVPLPDIGTASLRDAMISHYDIRHLHGITPGNPGSVADFVTNLRKLQPRLYSIASSLKAHPEEVHLCVGAVRYEVHGIVHKGVASTFLAERLPLGETTGIFFHVAKHFRLPTDRTKPVIMVGPGTGIAPFRAFLEEREATGSPGKNWLFFGDQRRATDFLYHDQIIEWVQKGVLSRLDTAFSRDQEEKVYVQTRMLTAAAEFWQWLEEGAHFYVCGDAKRMAKDVDAALHEIIQTAGGNSAEEATAYIADMKKNKRYQRDVY
ncbi:sulfite reductase (NADPH) flavoprotein alpha-component [Prosthecobacter fusiformis]|uniref:assimilatory sulfite reductase (NADPH) n=1 Tax=Prosthecobacter fusiformis TaxID=48464 RepID=A0A4R7S513_9BACT|nr:flavodoxin domain-containing protein [Prosthecobacter fusiformis]TDU73434.1 sulfite reductase (NADPH) flavoprotein alpha-component [Prosthecobacter fusiformis]